MFIIFLNLIWRRHKKEKVDCISDYIKLNCCYHFILFYYYFWFYFLKTKFGEQLQFLVKIIIFVFVNAKPFMSQILDMCLFPDYRPLLKPLKMLLSMDQFSFLILFYFYWTQWIMFFKIKITSKDISHCSHFFQTGEIQFWETAEFLWNICIKLKIACE